MKANPVVTSSTIRYRFDPENGRPTTGLAAKLGLLSGSVCNGAAMSDATLTDALACRVMGWKAAPDRFIKSGRSWIPRWRFQPLVELADAFSLLDQVAHQYSLACDSHRTFTVEVRVGTRRGKASGKHKARVITFALARALELEVGE